MCVCVSLSCGYGALRLWLTTDGTLLSRRHNAIEGPLDSLDRVQRVQPTTLLPLSGGSIQDAAVSRSLVRHVPAQRHISKAPHQISSGAGTWKLLRHDEEAVTRSRPGTRNRTLSRASQKVV